MTIFQGHKSVKQCGWKDLCDYVKTLYDRCLPQLGLDCTTVPTFSCIQGKLFMFPDLTETWLFLGHCLSEVFQTLRD